MPIFRFVRREITFDDLDFFFDDLPALGFAELFDEPFFDFDFFVAEVCFAVLAISDSFDDPRLIVGFTAHHIAFPRRCQD